MYDLHCHSHCSDGRLSPADVVSRAHANGVQTLALTDHDTINGYEEARLRAEELGLNLITGIEISCQWDGRGVHIVGLNFDPHHTAIKEVVTLQGSNRILRAQRIGEKLAKLGIAGAYEGACEIAGGAVVGRPHFAQFLVSRGVVKSAEAAFKKYLGTGKPGDVKQLWPTMPEALDYIHRAGGISVLAHPDKYNVTRTRLRAMIADFVEAGGQAMEVISGGQDKNITQEMGRLIKSHGLLASVGSDFHFTGAPWQELGRTPPLPDTLEPVWQRWE